MDAASAGRMARSATATEIRREGSGTRPGTGTSQAEGATRLASSAAVPERALESDERKMNIDGIGPSVPPKAIEPTAQVGNVAPKPEAAKAADVVEISDIAKLAAKVQELPEVRADLVERVRGEIADGTYDTPERVDAAVERLMDDLLGTA